MAAAGVQTAPQPALPEADLTRQRRWVMGIVNVSHTFNHMNSSMMAILFGVMMEPLGFGYAQLGVLSTAHMLVGNAMQAMYGFITQFVKRAVVLGAGNMILGVATFLTAGVQNFGQLVVLRAAAGAGSSPQHPVGASVLSSYFPSARGQALGLHNTAGSVGTFIAPLLVAGLLVVMEWRTVLMLLGIPSIVLGLSYFLLRDVVKPAGGNRRTLAKAGLSAYVACLKNRDLMLVSLLMMVGAAGRGGGINQTYLVPHFIHDLAIAAAGAAALLTIVNVGGLVAPLSWGWLSDHFPRKFVMQISLALSAITTVWLGLEGAFGFTLIASLVIYGLAVHARQAITQAMVADYAGPEHEDAAYSIYFTVGFISAPLWTLLMGAIMQEAGFTIATQVIAVSYVIGMLLLIPMRIRPKEAQVVAGS